MNRTENWRPDLYQAIDAHRPHPFAWGVHDCAILTADAILAVTGRDLALGLRGRYADQAGSRAVLAEIGRANVVAILEANFEEIHPSKAQVGDVAVIKTARFGLATGPVVGAEVVVYSSLGEVALVSLVKAVRAFRIET
jgi:hypothetical protein